MSGRKAKEAAQTGLMILCQLCGRRGPNAGHLVLQQAADPPTVYGPLCFACMDWVQRRVRETARADRVDEIKIAGAGS